MANTRGLVLHIVSDDRERILGAVASARNAIAALGDDLQVDIVTQGGAVVGVAKESEESGPIAEALAETPNVNVHLCSLAAKGNGITADEQLIERAHLAPTATAHCAKRQLEGWAYVRG